MAKGASFIKADFTQGIIDDVKFTDGTKFESYNFSNKSMNRAIIEKVMFNDNCILNNMSFVNTKFNDVRIQDSYLEGIKFTSSKMSKIYLDKVKKKIICLIK